MDELETKDSSSRNESSDSSRASAHMPPGVSRESTGSLVSYALVALGVALLIRFFIAAPYLVSGSSMEPTFYDLQYLIIDRVVYEIHPPQRGDVVVFKYPPEPSRSLIKRVIGLPEETVVLHRGTVTIINAAHEDGFVLSEPYLSSENRVTGDESRVTLKENEYFVLGDNRHVSADSRIWGTLPEQDITGRVDLRLYPIKKIGVLPGEARYSE